MKKLTFSLILFIFSAMNAQVGINTTTPDVSAALDVTATNKGFLPPRITLLSPTDGITIPSPATGLMVYHMGNTILEAGIYSNIGTPASPIWSKGAIINDSTGSKVYKAKFRGRNKQVDGYPKPSVKVLELNLEFRFAIIPNGDNFLQVRLMKQPTANVIVNYMGHWQGASHNHSRVDLTFTSANFSTWQNVDTNWNNAWGYYYLFNTTEKRTDEFNPFNYAMNLYGICTYGSNLLGQGEANEIYSLAAEVF